MTWLLAALCGIAAIYQLVAIAACLRHLFQSDPLRARSFPGVSILKPVRGLHSGFEEAIRSHTGQDYPEFELLLGHRDPNDAAIAEMDRLGVRHFVCDQAAPNGKAAVLMDLIQHARYPVIIVNDADIVVPVNYIRDVTAPLADPLIGLVTCLYRAEGDSWPNRFEALGVATDFAPSALVAPLAGVSEFGFGSTLAFRRTDLDAIGGFHALADYLADDYQLGARIHQLGRRNLVSRVVVKTRLHSPGWMDVWRHQVRWARTVRLSRFIGYAGLPVTFATLWALLAAGAGWWWVAFALLALRLIMAVTGGWFVIRNRDSRTWLALVPLRDLFGVAVWIAGLIGDTVEWGGQVLHLDSQGRIKDRKPAA